MSAQRKSDVSMYIGPERRLERRRRQSPGFEKLLLEFGLDRRNCSERRRVDSSWLLISDDLLEKKTA